MAVPNFQEFFRPMLEVLAEGGELHMTVIGDRIAQKMKLSEADLSDMLPSGRFTKFRHRCGWSRTYLSKAKLIERVGRGSYRISTRGMDALASGSNIKVSYLSQFEEFKAFQSSKTQDSSRSADDTENEEQDDRVLIPLDEQMDRAYRIHRQQLASEILDAIFSCSDVFFEHLVIEVLQAMGYGGSHRNAARRLGQTGDQGIDGVIDEDRLGLDSIYLQAKRWARGRNVGSRDIRDFIGALAMRGVTKGVFITTSDFTKDAKEAADSAHGKRVILINGDRLAELMMDHDVGVNVQERYILKRVDLDFFSEE